MWRNPGVERRQHNQLQQDERGQGGRCLAGVQGHLFISKSVIVITVVFIRNVGYGFCQQALEKDFARRKAIPTSATDRSSGLRGA
jgi:hypothetical protein